MTVLSPSYFSDGKMGLCCGGLPRDLQMPESGTYQSAIETWHWCDGQPNNEVTLLIFSLLLYFIKSIIPTYACVFRIQTSRRQSLKFLGRHTSYLQWVQWPTERFILQSISVLVFLSLFLHNLLTFFHNWLVLMILLLTFVENTVSVSCPPIGWIEMKLFFHVLDETNNNW